MIYKAPTSIKNQGVKSEILVEYRDFSYPLVFEFDAPRYGGPRGSIAIPFVWCGKLES